MLGLGQGKGFVCEARATLRLNSEGPQRGGSGRTDRSLGIKMADVFVSGLSHGPSTAPRRPLVAYKSSSSCSQSLAEGWATTDQRPATLTGIVFVLKTGIPWEYLPREPGCGSGMTCWRRLHEWMQAGVWQHKRRAHPPSISFACLLTHLLEVCRELLLGALTRMPAIRYVIVQAGRAPFSGKLHSQCERRYFGVLDFFGLEIGLCRSA